MERDTIAFVGRSNVGKSSTIRALTGVKVRVGKKPGTTIRPNLVPYGRYTILDMPGFGFMRREGQEAVKDYIVRRLEEGRDIAFAVEVVDAKAFVEIARRWEARGQIPVEVEFYHFLNELDLNPIVVANKIDKIPGGARDEVLDAICTYLGLAPPWRGWRAVIVPFSARTREGLGELKALIGERARARG